MALTPGATPVKLGLRDVAATGGTKLVALPIAAVFAFATTRLLVGQLGPELYGVATLVVSLSALLPFADLGVGAAVVNAVGRSNTPGNDEQVARVLLTCLRGLVTSSCVIVATSLAIGWLGLWSVLLGVSDDSTDINAAVVGTLILFAFALPFSLGQRILLGAGRASMMVILQSLTAPLTLALTFIVVKGGGAFEYLVWAGPASWFIVAVFTTVLSGRITGVHLAHLYARILRPSRHPGLSVRRTAAPMVIITLGIPLALQTDRLVLSHRSSLANLASYALAFQLFAPLWTVLAATGTAMWPMFAGRRERGDRPELGRAITFLLVIAAFGGAALLVAGPFGARLLGRGDVAVSRSLLACFALLLAVQAVQLPIGMYLTTERGLRFQAVCVCTMVPISVGLGWWLAVSFGANGPVLASAVAVACCQVLPGGYWLRQSNQGESNSPEPRVTPNEPTRR